MRINGIKAKAKKRFNRRKNTKAATAYIASDLVKRNFNPFLLNQIWSADITYIRVKEGWCHLAVIMDLCSRKIISWAMSSKQDTALTKKSSLAGY